MKEKQGSVRISGTRFQSRDPGQNPRFTLSASFRGGHYAITGDSSERVTRGTHRIDSTPEEPCTVCAPATVRLAEELFERWNTALGTLNPDAVVACYWGDAVLLPTVSNVARTTPDEIRDYFVHFLEKSPQGHITERNIKIGCNKLTDAGHYRFHLQQDGVPIEVAARYTFVYENRHGHWKILHHHSSVLPMPS